MKKKAVLIIGIIVAVFLVYFIGSGFMKNSSLYIENYTLSEDDTEITIHTGVASSMGYIRSVSVH